MGDVNELTQVVCPICGEPITEDQEALWDESGAKVHKTCLDELQTTDFGPDLEG